MRPSPYELQPAGELQGIMPKIYCERCWLILEDIEMIFLKQNDMWFSVSVMVLVLHVILIFILHSWLCNVGCIVQYIVFQGQML